MQLKELLQSLLTLREQSEIESCLRAMLDLFLRQYALCLNGHIVVPTEVEAYYFNPGIYEDECVHRNSLQQDNFGNLYVHRAKMDGTADDKYKGRAGVDICLSDGQYKLAFLLRAVQIDDSPERVIGPVNVRKKFIDLLGPDATMKTIEEQKNILLSIPEHEVKYVLYSSRIGLTSGYKDAELRAIGEKSLVNKKYRNKEQMARLFLSAHPDVDSVSLIGYRIS